MLLDLRPKAAPSRDAADATLATRCQGAGFPETGAEAERVSPPSIVARSPGVHFDSLSGRTGARTGRAPTVSIAGKRFMLDTHSAAARSGECRVTVRLDVVTGQIFLEFVRRLPLDIVPRGTDEHLCAEPTAAADRLRESRAAGVGLFRHPDWRCIPQALGTARHQLTRPFNHRRPDTLSAWKWAIMQISALAFAPQCCDAVRYLDRSQECLQTLGACYDSLRPVGAQLWFVWPLALGLPSEILILVHWVLLALSVLLSTLAIRHWAAWAGCRTVDRWLAPLFLSSLAIHLIFSWPVMNVALTDLPAGIFALLALWNLVLSVGRERHLWLPLGIAGLLLGSAAWMRSFYLYPLVGTIAVYALSWIMVKPRRLSELALLVALLPVAIQLAATWYVDGVFGYIGPKQSHYWTAIHLSSNLAGYDTMVSPVKGYPWESNCDGEGLIRSATNGAFRDAACLIESRLDFYFGSYSPVTYHQGAAPHRYWSSLLYAGNLLVLACFAVVTWRGRGWLSRPMLPATAFVWLSLGQALLLIPEQRFVAPVQVAAWLATAGTLLALLGNCSTERRVAPGEA